MYSYLSTGYLHSYLYSQLVLVLVVVLEVAAKSLVFSIDALLTMMYTYSRTNVKHSTESRVAASTRQTRTFCDHPFESQWLNRPLDSFVPSLHVPRCNWDPFQNTKIRLPTACRSNVGDQTETGSLEMLEPTRCWLGNTSPSRHIFLPMTTRSKEVD